MRSLVAVGAVLVFVGCSPEAEPGRAPSGSAVGLASDWPADFEWLSGEGRDGEAWLYFGPDESDNIHMHFRCAPGSNEVVAEAFDLSGEGAELTLSSADQRTIHAARAIRDHEIFGDAVKSQARIMNPDPVLTAFQRTGILAAGSVEFRTANPGELERIQRFFAICNGP